MPDDESPMIELDDAQLILIVVGAHLRAEVGDRPLAYKLHNRISAWLDKRSEMLGLTIVPMVCCDVWYMNQQALHGRPTISVGGPGVNALSAYFAQKLTAALARDDHLIVQLDAEFVDLRACIWGMDHAQTVRAVDLFVEKYLDGYLRAVATQVEPMGES